jgi:PAS domain S-box-containing protein
VKSAHTHDGIVEYEFAWKQGAKTIYCHATATPIENGKHVRQGTLLIIRDVTREHTLAESLARYNEGLEVLVNEQTRKLSESERRFRELLMYMNEGFMTVDGDARIRFVNDRIGEVLRFDPAGIAGRDLFDFIQLDDRDRLRRALSQVREGRHHANDQEYTMVREDGGYVPVKVSIAPVRGEDENEPHFSLVITDVHELKEMHRQLEFRAAELERVNEELRELDRAKDTFLSNVSHELRTPLGTLDGYMDMLMSGTLGDLDGPQTGAVRVMQRNVERLTSMINEMIEFSRMEIRGVKLFYTVFDVNKLVKECAASAHPAAFQKDVEIDIAVESRRRYMWGDRAKIVQILGILLSNAVKFTHEEGRIQVRLEIGDDGEIRIAVRDNGIGVESAYQERIFQKFYQVDSSMTRQFEGTGIGLSIAQNVVAAHGGRIELESTYKEGSTFTVHFPKALLDVDSASLGQLNLDGAHVFVVNQLVDFREACAHILNKMGCIVTEFESAYDAIRAAHTQEPGLFLLGETLPDVSGVVAVSLVKEDLSISHVPVILMKSKTTHDADDTGMDAIELEKPFTINSFIQAIRAAHVSPEVQAGQGG